MGKKRLNFIAAAPNLSSALIKSIQIFKMQKKKILENNIVFPGSTNSKCSHFTKDSLTCLK
jgi:hypothetical protein